MTVEVQDSNFSEEVLKSSKPVLVDFWASWCGPCKMLAPVLDTLGESFPDLVVAKYNMEQTTSEYATQYGVRSLPTLIIFRDGQPLAVKVGNTSRVELVKWISTILGA